MLQSKPYRFMWYQDTLNLFDSKIVGPFDFDPGFIVPSTAFNRLLEVAGALGVYVGNVDRVVPLDKKDPLDCDDQGASTGYLCFRWNLLHGTE